MLVTVSVLGLSLMLLTCNHKPSVEMTVRVRDVTMRVAHEEFEHSFAVELFAARQHFHVLVEPRGGHRI